MKHKFIAILNTLIILSIASCLKTELSENQTDANSTTAGNTDGTKGPPTSTTTDYESQLKSVTKILPASFEVSVSSDIIISNPNGRDLDKVHVNLFDSSGNNYFSGSGLSLKNELKHGPLSLGGVSFINVEVSHGQTAIQRRLKIKKDKPITIQIF